jgi:hypothetical protein
MRNLQPTAVIGGIALYEHPKYGDECPLLFKIDGAFVLSDLFNEPNLDPAEVRQSYEIAKEEDC